MDSNQRRKAILEELNKEDSCISASTLAGLFGVTRQIIVSDIALLRANGHKVISTNKGYTLKSAEKNGEYISVVCRHSAEQTRDEFYAAVDNGGVVENVIIDHPLYGQISADLNIASRYDAVDFMERAGRAGAGQLCDLTGGIHVHTIRVPDKKAGERIRAALKAAGILAEE